MGAETVRGPVFYERQCSGHEKIDLGPRLIHRGANGGQLASHLAALAGKQCAASDRVRSEGRHEGTGERWSATKNRCLEDLKEQY